MKLSVTCTVYYKHSQKHAARSAASARSADRRPQDHIMRADCHRLACATQAESVRTYDCTPVPYVFSVGAAWQIAARARATARGVTTQDTLPGTRVPGTRIRLP